MKSLYTVGVRVFTSPTMKSVSSGNSPMNTAIRNALMQKNKQSSNKPNKVNQSSITKSTSTRDRINKISKDNAGTLAGAQGGQKISNKRPTNSCNVPTTNVNRTPENQTGIRKVIK